MTFEEYANKRGLGYFINGSIFQWTSSFLDEENLRHCWYAAIESTKVQEKPVAALFQKPIVAGTLYDPNSSAT